MIPMMAMNSPLAPDKNHDVVLVVDDAPETLQWLNHCLSNSGYMLLMSTDSAAALRQLDLVTPDAILLDAMMPGMNGFDLCAKIKAQPEWHHIPVIFMTGLTDTEHVLQGFDAGGVDYVVKPVKEAELLARLNTHVRNARVSRMARDALDVGGRGILLLDARGRIGWCSPAAQRAMNDLLDKSQPVEYWVHQLQKAQLPLSGSMLLDGGGIELLRATALGPVGFGESLWLIDREPRAMSVTTRVQHADLTAREAEVLSWLAKGKTNRDIGDILGISHRTVNKHLEHIFEKLGVETRAAAVLASLPPES
jgi:DNA-binding NarL/FixJ family response regulator